MWVPIDPTSSLSSLWLWMCSKSLKKLIWFTNGRKHSFFSHLKAVFPKKLTSICELTVLSRWQRMNFPLHIISKRTRSILWAQRTSLYALVRAIFECMDELRVLYSHNCIYTTQHVSARASNSCAVLTELNVCVSIFCVRGNSYAVSEIKLSAHGYWSVFLERLLKR